MIYFEVKQKGGEIVISNIHECQHLDFFKEEKNLTLRNEGIKSVVTQFDDISVWLIVENEKDLLNSNRLFNKAMKIHADLAHELLGYYLNKIKAHSHTLRSIQGKMKQKIDGLASKGDFHGNNYAESKEKISAKIREDIDKTADTICFLNKRVAEIDAHIEGFDVLYMGDEQEVELRDTNIKKVLLNIYAPFLSEFTAQGIEVNFVIKDDYADSNKVSVDYKMFNLAMTNFFDNSIKYGKPYEPIQINFIKESRAFALSISMMSRRIDEDELFAVFKEGYSGRHAQRDAGDGIGMSVIKRALALSRMKIDIRPNYSEAYTNQGHQYVRNIFKISSI